VAGKNQISRKRLKVSGQVQGVGFRPFVYRLAVELHLSGFVLNDAQGVTIEVQGRQAALRDFVRRLQGGPPGGELPPLAEISRCDEQDAVALGGESRFEIRPSLGGELADAQVTVDTATCKDCLREMFDPGNPRYRYPFINCTNCGPRYSIVRRIPYDRPNTTMAEFAMCSLCGREYRDPASRRFHAQPIACGRCGPSVWLVDTHGRQIQCDEPIAEAAEMLLAGRIVAIKGLGGFHLACRADEDNVVRRLRLRKRRDAKPFAIMVADADQAAGICELTAEAGKLLRSPIRPVVLLPRRRGATIAPSVAEGLDTLGVMLPYTPLHHLLFAHSQINPLPLVMTSGNYSEEPLVKDNSAAISHLGRIADALLLHNRRIERRIDDSVVRISAQTRVQVFRRARGYAPQPIRVAEVGSECAGACPAVLAVGAELKNTVCLFKSGRAVVSEHVGDLKDGRVYRHFIDVINHLEALFEFTPELLAADMHPQYLSTEYAMRRHRGELAGRAALPIVRVQHHHAHIAACLAEHRRSEQVIGLVSDGTGYGDDGAVWGCEILRADLRDYRRLGHLRYVPLLGGDAAAVETYRPALAALYETFGPACLGHVKHCRLAASDEQLEAGLELLASGVNCPPTSSLGRWFDAVAGLLGIARANRFEGEAPMKLEAAVAMGVDDAYEFRILRGRGELPFTIDLRMMVEGIVADLSAGVADGVIAAKFHNTVAEFLTAAAGVAREQTRLGVVALSGGCFANRYLTARLTAALERDGFEVLRHHTIPCNDGGVALGQAVVAAERKLTPRPLATGVEKG